MNHTSSRTRAHHLGHVKMRTSTVNTWISQRWWEQHNHIAHIKHILMDVHRIW